MSDKYPNLNPKESGDAEQESGVDYKFYKDPLLRAVAEEDPHMDNLLEGLRLAEIRRNEHPDSSVHEGMIGIVEDNIRDRVQRLGYLTSEPLKPEDSPEL